MTPLAPRVVIATLTWNQKTAILECLDSLAKLDYPHYEVVVVDNGSTDGTFEAVRSQFPNVFIVRNNENLGCSEGLNGEVRYALQSGADYLFIIANDGKVEPSTLTELVRVAERDPKIGVVFPKVYYWGSEKKIWFAKGARVQEIDWLRGKFTGFVQNVEDDGSYDREEEAHLYPGGFCLARMEAVKKAGFHDPAYYLFFEDAEWLLHIHQAGYTGRYAPRARAWHKPSSSVGMESESFYYYRTRNRLYFYEKFCPRWIFPFFLAYFFFELFFVTLPGFFRSRRGPQMRGSVLGWMDYLRRKRGRREFGRPFAPSFLKIYLRLRDKIRRKGTERCFKAKLEARQKVRIRVRLEWNLGDEIMALPAFEILKRRCPDSLIEAVVRYPELVQGNPFVDLINPKEFFAPNKTFDLHFEVRGRSRLESIRQRLQANTLGFPKIYLRKDEIENVKKRWNLEPEKLKIGISPAARWFSRRWPRRRWVELAEYFKNRHGAEVWVLGKDEIPLPVGVDFIGETSVRETAILLSQCRLFVGSDSGLVHLALAVGIPTVGLFGPLNPGFLIEPRPSLAAVWSSVECRGCWSDGRMKYPDHCPKVVPDCLESISLEKVIEASEKLLEARLPLICSSGD